MTITKSPETYEDLIIFLPIANALIDGTTTETIDLAVSQTDQQGYRIDLSSIKKPAESSKITVLFRTSKQPLDISFTKRCQFGAEVE